MSPARFRWGMLFILIGALLFLNNIGWLEWWVWGDILSLWPLLLIAIGVEKIFAKSKWEVVSYLSTVALAAVVIWAAWGGMTDESYWGSSSGRSRYKIESDESIRKLTAEFNMDDTDLYLKKSRRDLFSSRFGGLHRTPKINYDIEDNIARIEVKAGKRWRFFFGRRRASDDLDAYLTDEVPISLTCLGDKSDMKIDCRDLRLEELSVDSRRGDIRIFVGRLLEKVRLDLEGEEADFRLNLPRDCGLRVSGAENDIARYLKRIGLNQSDNYFVSEKYDSLTPLIELDLVPDISRLAINYY
jgi:hypothetical protein